MNSFAIGLLIGFGMQTKQGKKLVNKLYENIEKVAAKTEENITQIVEAVTGDAENGKSKNSGNSIKDSDG